MIGGALGAALYCSRLLAVAPYRDNGSRFQLSKPLVIYGGMIASLTIASYANVEMFFTLSYFKPSTSLELVQLISRIIIFIISIAGMLSAPGRIKRIAHISKELQKIDETISWPGGAKMTSEIKLTCVIFTYYITIFILQFSEFCILVDFFSYAWVGNGQITIFLTYCQILSLLITQITLVAQRVLLRLKTVNDTLEQQVSINVTRYPNKCIIRRLAECYTRIYDIMCLFQGADGLLMGLTMCHFLIRLGVNVHKFIFMGFILNDKKFIAIIEAVLFIVTLTGLILVIEPYHRTHSQMVRTVDMVNRLKSFTRTSREADLNKELALFQRLLELNKLSYSPLEMCTLGRPIVFKILGCFISFVVIILTYGPEIHNPNLYH